MPRKSNIKWRESDTENIMAEVKRFNAKIYRTRKRRPDLADILPETIKSKDVKAKIESLKSMPRSETNKYLKKLDRFSKKGAEERTTAKFTGHSTTKWERREVAILVRADESHKAHMKKVLNEVEVKSQGEPTGMKRKEMGSERMSSLEPSHYDFDKKRGGKEWEIFVKGVEKRANANREAEKAEMYKKAYLKSIDTVYQGYGSEIYDTVNSLPAEVVLATYYSEQEATIEFHYSPEEMMTKLETLHKIWDTVLEDYQNETDSGL